MFPEPQLFSSSGPSSGIPHIADLLLPTVWREPGMGGKEESLKDIWEGDSRDCCFPTALPFWLKMC